MLLTLLLAVPVIFDEKPSSLRYVRTEICSGKVEVYLATDEAAYPMIFFDVKSGKQIGWYDNAVQVLNGRKPPFSSVEDICKKLKIE